VHLTHRTIRDNRLVTIRSFANFHASPRHLARVICALWLALVAIGTPLVAAGPQTTATSAIAAQDSTSDLPKKEAKFSEKRIYDPDDLINEEGESSMESDAIKTTRAGIAVVVYIRISDDTPEEAQAFATALYDEWDVESAARKDDGLLIVATVPSDNPRGGFVSFAWGNNTFPVNAVDPDRLEEIREEIIDPYFHQGNIYRGLYIALRQINYDEVFVPGDAPSLNAFQRAIHNILLVAAPVLGIIALLAIIIPWFTKGRWPRALAFIRTRRRMLIGVVTFLVILMPLTVIARSTISVAVCLFVGIALVLDLGFVQPRMARIARAANVRTVHVRPRASYARSAATRSRTTKGQHA